MNDNEQLQKLFQLKDEIFLAGKKREFIHFCEEVFNSLETANPFYRRGQKVL